MELQELIIWSVDWYKITNLRVLFFGKDDEEDMTSEALGIPLFSEIL